MSWRSHLTMDFVSHFPHIRLSLTRKRGCWEQKDHDTGSDQQSSDAVSNDGQKWARKSKNRTSICRCPSILPASCYFLFRGFLEPGGVRLSSNPHCSSLKYLPIFLLNTCKLFGILTIPNIHFFRGEEHHWAPNKFYWNYPWCWDLISERWGSAQHPSLSMYRYNYFAQGLAVYIYLCRISFAILLSSDLSLKVLARFFTVRSHCHAPCSPSGLWVIC